MATQGSYYNVIYGNDDIFDAPKKIVKEVVHQYKRRTVPWFKEGLTAPTGLGNDIRRVLNASPPPESFWDIAIARLHNAADFLTGTAANYPLATGAAAAAAAAAAGYGAYQYFKRPPTNARASTQTPTNAMTPSIKSSASKKAVVVNDEFDEEVVPPNTIRFHRTDQEYAPLDMLFKSPFTFNGYRWSTLQRLVRARPGKRVDRHFRAALFAQFKQNPALTELLLSTGDKKLEYNIYNTYWGIGQESNGENALGVELMRLRHHLRKRRSMDRNKRASPLSPNV